LIEARLHGDQLVRLKIHAVESLMVNMPAFWQWAAGDVFPDHAMNVLVSMWPGMKPWIALRRVATPFAERMSAGEFQASFHPVPSWRIGRPSLSTGGVIEWKRLFIGRLAQFAE